MTTSIYTMAAIATFILYFFKSTETLQAVWVEESRENKPFKKYPPCYDICGATRNVYNILEQKQLLGEYSKLLNAYSIVLCQEKFGDQCKKEMLDQRIADLQNLGGQINQRSLDMVKKYVKTLRDNKIGTLLGLATNVITKELYQMQQDARLTMKEKLQVLKMNETFYDVHYDITNELCKTIR